MSHEFESGFVVRDAAWHGLATVLSDPPTTAEGLRRAGLDWDVRLAPILAMDYASDVVNGTAGELTGMEIPISSHRAVVRSTDQRVLGVVGADYVPVQNREAFAFFDPLIEQGHAALESAGSLKEGKRVWVLARILGSGSEVSEGDRIEPYLLVSTAHDGSRAVTVDFTAVRVVCWNTLGRAERPSDAARSGVRIRHVGDPAGALAQVSTFVDAARRTFALSLEDWRAMRSRGIDANGLERYVTRVLRAEESREGLERELGLVEDRLLSLFPEEATQRIALLERAGELRAQLESRPRAFEDVARLFEEGPGVAMAGATVYGAYNAVTHWIDHERGRSAENRLESTWFGVGRSIRARAHTEAMALVGGS